MPPANDPNINPQAGQGKPLPKKESDLFKNVVKQYEQKQYKKALKHADTILKKFPNHGETLAMKGLVLNSMNKRADAHALVKQGLMNDMRYEQIGVPMIVINPPFSYLAFSFLSSFAFCQVSCMLACLWSSSSIGSKLQRSNQSVQAGSPY
jgi:hypothetical protein